VSGAWRRGEGKEKTPLPALYLAPLYMLPSASVLVAATASIISCDNGCSLQPVSAPWLTTLSDGII